MNLQRKRKGADPSTATAATTTTTSAAMNFPSTTGTGSRRTQPPTSTASLLFWSKLNFFSKKTRSNRRRRRQQQFEIQQDLCYATGNSTINSPIAGRSTTTTAAAVSRRRRRSSRILIGGPHQLTVAAFEPSQLPEVQQQCSSHHFTFPSSGPSSGSTSDSPGTTTTTSTTARRASTTESSLLKARRKLIAEFNINGIDEENDDAITDFSRIGPLQQQQQQQQPLETLPPAGSQTNTKQQRQQHFSPEILERDPRGPQHEVGIRQQPLIEENSTPITANGGLPPDGIQTSSSSNQLLLRNGTTTSLSTRNNYLSQPLPNGKTKSLRLASFQDHNMELETFTATTAATTTAATQFPIPTTTVSASSSSTSSIPKKKKLMMMMKHLREKELWLDEEMSVLDLSRILQRNQGDSREERTRLLSTLEQIIIRTDPTTMGMTTKKTSSTSSINTATTTTTTTNQTKNEKDPTTTTTSLPPLPPSSATPIATFCHETETLIAVLVWTLQRHVSIPSVQQAGCMIWKNLIILTTDDKYYPKAGHTVSNHLHVIVDCLLGALLRHGGSNATIAIGACDALTRLVGRMSRDRSLCRRVVETIVSTILQAPRIYPHPPSSSISSSSSTTTTSSTTVTTTPHPDATTTATVAPSMTATIPITTPPYQRAAAEAQEERSHDETKIEQQETSAQVHQAALGALRLLGYSMRTSGRARKKKSNISRPILDILVAAMQRHPDHVMIQEYACETIWNIFSSNGGSQGKMSTLLTKDRESGGIVLFKAISVIVAAMKEYPGQVNLQEMAMYALASLGNLMHNGNIKRISVLETESSVSQLGDMAKVIAGNMQRYPMTESVQIAACSALWRWTSPSSASFSFSGTPENPPPHQQNQELHATLVCQILLATRGMMNTIFTTMNQHTTSSSVQKRAAGILYQLVLAMEKQPLEFVLVDHSAQNTFEYSLRLLISAKAMDALFTIVQKHPQKASTQELVCQTLAHLLESRNPNLSVGLGVGSSSFCGNDTSQPLESKGSQRLSPSSSSTLLKAGHRVTAIMSTLQRFPQHKLISTSGCQILRHFMAMISSFDSDDYDDEDDKNTTNQLAWILRGIPALVISCMQQNLAYVPLQEVTCSILRSFADRELYHESIASMRGLDLLLQVMKRHTDNASIQTAAGGTLQLMAIRLDSVPMISVKEAIETITEVMHRHETIAAVQQGGLFALRFWAWDGACQEWMLAANIRDRILSAMEQHGCNPLVQEVGCDILGTLSRFVYEDHVMNPSEPSLSSHPNSLGRTVRVILSALKCHSTHHAVQEATLDALYRLLKCQDAKLIAETIRSGNGMKTIVSSMGRHMEDTTLQQHGCYVLWRLVPSAATDATFELSDLEILLNIMRQQTANIVIQNSVSSLLKDLSELSAKLTLYVASSERSLDTILGSLQHHIQNEIVATSVCYLLARVVATPNCRTASSMLSSPTGAETITSVMRQHQENPTIQKEASTALCRLAIKHPDLVAGVASSPGAIQAIVSAMKQNGRNSSFQELGCQFLYECVTNQEVTAVPLISAAGGVDVILQAMKSDIMNDSLQGHACSALGKLSIALDSMTSPTSGISTIISSMKHHQLKNSVQEGVLYALRFLAWNSDNQRIIMSWDGVEAIASAMRVHPFCYKIQELGCGTLDNLANCDKNHTAIASSGAIDLVLLAMQRHAAASPLVPEYGCSVLGRIAADESTKALICRFGGIDTILSTMEINGENPAVQKEAFGALCIITTGDPANHGSLTSGDGIGRILSSMEQHKSRSAVQTRGCAVLRNLCFTRENRVSIALAGGIETILTAMRKHKGILPLQKHAFGALLHLTLAENNQASMVASDGFNTILETMMRHIENKQLQEMGCDIIINLATNQSISKSTVSATGIDTIMSAMKYHVESPVIQERGCDALMSMAMRLVAVKTSAVAKTAIDAVLSAMRRHTKIEPVQERCLQTLRFYAFSKKWQDYIVSTGGVDLIILALQIHVESEVVQQEACGIIGDLAASDEKNVAMSKAIQPLLSALERNREDQAVQESCCGALCTLSKESSNQIAIASSGGIEGILKVMRRDPGKLSIQIQGCEALANLALNDTNKVSIGAAHGIITILSAMRIHSGHPELQKQACDALWHLAENATNQVIIATVGGIDSIMSTMKRHSKRAGIQKRGCGALAQLALNVENQFYIASAGRVDVILAALDVHRGDTGVQLEACRAIRNLASSSSSRRIISSLVVIESVLLAMEENLDRGSIHEVACEALLCLELDPSNALWQQKIATILSCMRRNQDQTSVQESCLGILRSFSLNDRNKTILSTGGAIKIVLSSMKHHPQSELIQERSCATLWNLSYRNKANNVSVCLAGGIEAILSAMQLHSASSAVQEEGCGILWDLAFEVSNRSKIASLGGVSVLLAAMRKFRSDVSVQGRACAALSHLAEDQSIGGYISSAGGIEDVSIAMRDHIMDTRVQEGGCKALGHLALDHKNKRLISEAGGIQVILSSITNLVGNQPILEHALAVIEKLVSDDDCKDVIGKAGGIAIILGAMRLDPGNVTVQDLGCTALIRFAAAQDDDKLAIATAGGIEILVSAMQQHKGNVGLQYQAGRILWNLTFNKFCRGKMEDLGAMCLVESAISKHGSALTDRLDHDEDNPADH